MCFSIKDTKMYKKPLTYPFVRDMMLNIETKKEIKAPGRAVTSQYVQIIKNEESIHNLRQVKYSLFFIS